MFWDLGGDKTNELVNLAIAIKGNPGQYCTGDFSSGAIDALIKQSEICAAGETTLHEDL